jgi:pyridoxal phosphate enzyme (YggS family)
VNGDRDDAAAVAANVAEVRERIAAAARRAGRETDEVRLVAATKTVPAVRLRPVLDAGVADLGENRAQELLAKAPDLAGVPAPPRWHFLGALQRNKVRALAPWVVCWQSVDRPELGPVLGRHASGATVLIEVNLGREPQKSGCAPEAAGALRDTLAGHGLVVAGLMAVPPAHDDPRPWFAALRELGERLGVPELSMGMTDDYETAVEEGATIVRVGRALFGARPTT